MNQSHPYRDRWERIRAELQEIAPQLAKRAGRNPFSVPKAYFEGLAEEVQSQIGADVPDGYFDSLPDRVMDKIQAEAYKLPPAPKHPYQVPSGYFESLSVTIANRVQTEPKSKVVPMYQRTWVQVGVAAAMILGVIATILLLTRSPKVDRQLAKLEQAELEQYIEENIDEYEMYQLVEYANSDELGLEILEINDSTLLEMEKEIDDILLEDIWL